MLIETRGQLGQRKWGRMKIFFFLFTFWPPSPISLGPKKVFEESLKKIFVFTWFSYINIYQNSTVCSILCPRCWPQNSCPQGAHRLTGDRHGNQRQYYRTWVQRWLLYIHGSRGWRRESQKSSPQRTGKGVSRVAPRAGHWRTITVGMDRKRRDLEELGRAIKADSE